MSTFAARRAACFALALACGCASEDVVLFEFEDTAETPPAGGTAGVAGTGSSSPPDVLGGGGNSGEASAGTSGAPLGGMSGAPSGTAGGAAGGGPGGPTAGSGASAPIVCHDNDECPEASTCEKTSCTALTGYCIRHPVCFDVAPDPVCGCDGITYWNDCLRQQVGAFASTPGECGTTARRCWERSMCGVPNAVCGQLFLPGEECWWDDGREGPPGQEPPEGRPPPQGTCWVVPERCDPAADPLRWNGCDGPQPDGPQPGPCVDTCEALRSGRPHVRDASGTCQ